MKQHFIFLRDTVTGELFDVLPENVELFQDEYENPQNLVCPEVWYADGAGFNGRLSRYAFGQVKQIKIVEVEGEKTNNEMEYAAVIAAMAASSQFDVIMTDSQLVFNQIGGKWRNNYAHLRELCKMAQQLLQSKSLSLKWIPREENLAGWELDR